MQHGQLQGEGRGIAISGFLGEFLSHPQQQILRMGPGKFLCRSRNQMWF